MQETTISRRAFLEATAIAGLAAVGGSSLSGLIETPEKAYAADETETKIIKTCCKGCVGDCGVLAHVRNGRVVKLEGDPEQIGSRGRMCAKGLSGIQALYNPNRVKYPLRRAGERGENKWERITWDEALATIAAQLKEASDKYGGESLIVGHGGGGHAYYSEAAKRFCHVFGCPNILEPGGLQCYEPRVVAYKVMWGSSPTDPVNRNCPEIQLTDDFKTKAMVLWGTNPACSSIGQVEQAVNEARTKGVKIVVIDPRFTPDASKADVWLPVRPQTDVALMLCWIKYIIDHDLYDHDVVMKWSTLPFLVHSETNLCLRPEDIGLTGESTTRVVWDRTSDSAKLMSYPWDDALDPALEGTFDVNGMQCKTGFQLLKERCAEWTLEKTAEVCWLEPDKIEEAIRIYADNAPAGIALGMAADHSRLSTQAGMGQFILDTLTGNICKPGTLMQKFDDSNPYFGDPGTLQHFMPYEQVLKRFGGIEYKGSGYNEWTHNHTCQEAMITGEPYQPRIFIERSTNKMMNMPNVKKWLGAIGNMELIVHHVMYPTSFSMYADILLPCTEWLEANWTVQIGNRVYVRQPATHLWETIEEPAFWGLLANKLAEAGHERFAITCDADKLNAVEPEQNFIGYRAEGEFPWWHSMEELLTNNFALNGGDMTWPEFVKYVEEHGSYETMPLEEYLQYEPYKKIDPETGLPIGFDTPSKKLEMYADQMITFGRTGVPYSYYEMPPASKDYDPLPYFIEPEEGPNNPEYAEEYPLLLIGGHIATYTHGTLRNVPWMRERHPVPEFLINPVDAEKYGIGDGDWVWLESKRGKTQGKATVSNMIRPGVTHMERFWFPETMATETLGCTEMNVNVLTNDGPPFNDITGSCTYRGFMIKVSRADGPPKGIWLEPEEFEPWLPDYEQAEITSIDDIEGAANHG